MTPMAFVLVALVGAPAVLVDLSGVWQVQSLGADREIVIEQQGTKIAAHRVLWPEVDGQKYRLEHLYRGDLRGTKIKGELLVKEEELPEFEVLRPFEGKIGPQGELTLDDLPLRRLAGASPIARTEGASPAPGADPKNEAAAATEPKAATAEPAPPPAPKSPSDEGDPGAALFSSIMGSSAGKGLFEVSRAITIPNAAADLVAQGDTLYARRDYARALAKYEAAEREGGSGATLWHRLGRCHLALRRFGDAERLLGRAVRLDPQNRALARDYAKARRGA